MMSKDEPRARSFENAVWMVTGAACAAWPRVSHNPLWLITIAMLLYVGAIYGIQRLAIWLQLSVERWVRGSP